MAEFEQWVNLERDAKFVADGITSIERVGEAVHFKCTFKGNDLGSFRYRVVPEETKRELIAAWSQHAGAPVFIDSAGKYGAGLALESLGKHLAALDIAPEEVVIRTLEKAAAR